MLRTLGHKNNNIVSFAEESQRRPLKFEEAFVQCLRKTKNTKRKKIFKI
jgi:hypothetical protein